MTLCDGRKKITFCNGQVILIMASYVGQGKISFYIGQVKMKLCVGWVKMASGAGRVKIASHEGRVKMISFIGQVKIILYWPRENGIVTQLLCVGRVKMASGGLFSLPAISLLRNPLYIGSQVRNICQNEKRCTKSEYMPWTNNFPNKKKKKMDLGRSNFASICKEIFKPLAQKCIWSML